MRKHERRKRGIGVSGPAAFHELGGFGLTEDKKEDQSGTSRYELHELMGQYAADRLHENRVEAAAACNRHRDYYNDMGGAGNDRRFSVNLICMPARSWSGRKGQWRCICKAGIRL